ncbi:hypothetical protein OFC46_26095, partial [Escherichia coli]|nr:hypothetical protein [Escherichia coli]
MITSKPAFFPTSVSFKVKEHAFATSPLGVERLFMFTTLLSVAATKNKCIIPKLGSGRMGAIG